ncbi:MAG: KH domain-containing protein [Nitrososphaerota archaeon]
MSDYVSEWEVVTPGQLLCDEPKKAGSHTYIYGGKVYSAVTGVVNFRNAKINVIPAKGPYRPQEDDDIIGIVIDIKPNMYEVDLGWHVIGLMKSRSKRRKTSLKLQVGDVVYTTVKYCGIRGVFLDGGESLKKIEKGLLVMINPVKIPRLIGKKGSMLNLLKRETNCQFYVGRNGLIAIIGPDSKNEFAAASAIKLIEEESHLKGLSDRVSAHIRKILLSGDEEDV